jgi:hypothetical protein
MRQRWEKRSEQLSGALWVLPLLFVVGPGVGEHAVADRHRAWLDTGSVAVPSQRRGGQAGAAGRGDHGRRGARAGHRSDRGCITGGVKPGIRSGCCATFLRDRTAQVVLGLFVATFTYNAAGLYTVGIPRGGSAGQYGRLAVTVGLCLLFVGIGALVYFVDRMVHSIDPAPPPELHGSSHPCPRSRDRP